MQPSSEHVRKYTERQHSVPLPAPDPTKKRPKKEKKPRKWLWMLISFLLGVTFSLACLGATIAVILYQPARNSLSMLGMRAENYLKEDYLDRATVDVISDVLNDFQLLSDRDNLSLGVLSKYTPAIDEMAQTLCSQMYQMGVAIDAEDLLSTPLGALGELMQTSVKNAALGTALNINVLSDPILLELCYGRAGEDYSVINGKIVMNGNKKPTTVGDLTSGATTLLQNLYVETAFSVTAASNELLRFLAYGKEGTHYVIQAGKVSMLANPVTKITYQKRTLKDLASDSLFDGVTIVFDEETDLSRLSVGDVVSVDETSPAFLQAAENCSLRDVGGEALNTFPLCDVLSLQNSVLLPLGDSMLGELTDASLGTLSLEDVFGDLGLLPETLARTAFSDFSDAVDKTALSELVGNEVSSRALLALGDVQIGNLCSAISNLSVKDVFGDVMYRYLDKEQNGGRGYEEIISSFDPNVDPATGAPQTMRPVYVDKNDATASDELERCLDGMWQLLLGGDDCLSCLELAQNLSVFHQTLASLPLWQLYLYGIIDENPYAPLPEVYSADDGTAYDNLNQITLNALIGFTKYLLQRV